MLVVIAVIGIVAAATLPSLSIENESKPARDKRNAQNFCTMYNDARIAGIVFEAGSAEGILDELIEGKTQGADGMRFKLPPLNESAKQGLITYCYMDKADNMRYSREPVLRVSESEITPESTPDHETLEMVSSHTETN